MSPFPVEEIIPQALETLAKERKLILQAPPGAGKSTVLPLRLLEAGWGKEKKILLLQPRKVAARAVAERLAQSLSQPVGKEIGLRIRFQTQVSAQTRLEVITEGVLIRLLQADPFLEDYGLIIFDEFHERSLDTDFGIAVCRKLAEDFRPDLGLLIMSATLTMGSLGSLQGFAPLLISEGKSYPVELRYLKFPPESAIQETMGKAILRVTQEFTSGDVLCFLPGSGEILRTQRWLQDNAEEALLSLDIRLLYGDLPFQQQQKALENHDNAGHRRVILSTPIAETSLTIPEVRVVIDSGFQRNPKYDARSGLTALQTELIALDSATQRAGRAGRVTAGVCFRLWTEEQQRKLLDAREPEIRQAELSGVILLLAGMGYPVTENYGGLPWAETPPKAAWLAGISLLQDLSFLDYKGKITPEGQQAMAWPTAPRLAALLERAIKGELQLLACFVLALLEEKDPYPSEGTADLMPRVKRLFQHWKNGNLPAGNVGKTLNYWLQKVCKNLKFTELDHNKLLGNLEQQIRHLGILVASAFPDRVAVQKDGSKLTYTLANGRQLSLQEGDYLSAEKYLAIAQANMAFGLENNKQTGKIYLAAALPKEELQSVANKAINIRWDNQTDTLLIAEEARVGSLIISTKPIHDAAPEDWQSVVFQQIRKEGWVWLKPSEEVEQLRFRMELLARYPELLPESVKPWPAVEQLTLLETIEDWLAPFMPPKPLKRKADIEQLPLVTALQAHWGYERMQLLDRLVPVQIPVPSGFNAHLQYRPEGEYPILAIRLQELFGLAETPSILQGKVPVLLHLLSPGYKPIQVTQDLRSFWNNTYPEIRKQLKIRYPKHSWPEDPWTAEAVRGVKRK